MDKDFYQMKDIIFGLRSEYLKIQEELNELRQIILDNDKRIVEYEAFFAITQKSELPALISKLKIKQSSLKRKLYDLENRLKTKHLKENEFEFVIDKQNLYNSLDKIKLGREKKRLREEFVGRIEQLLLSPFAQNFRDIKISNEENNNLYIGCNRITFYNNSDIYPSDMSYDKDKDVLVIRRRYPGVITDERIEHLLQMPILKSSFDEYMQECIEKNIELGKKIEIPQFRNYNSESLNIIEEENKIVLSSQSCKKKQKIRK